MFYLSYVVAELRRRSGRTVLTALGLAVGVALVVAVNALSTGLNDAQAKVLQPLTGVGTDMSVTRPLTFSSTGGNPFASLTPAQRQQLRQENGGTRFGFRNIAKPGQHFNVDRFTAAGQLTFPASKVAATTKLANVQSAAGSLTMTDLHISGTIPKNLPQFSPGQGGTSGGGFGQGGNGVPGGGFQRPGGGFGGRGFFGPNNINVTSRTVTGIDQTKPDLATVTPSQITGGHYFTASGGADQALLSTSYAHSQNLSVGSEVTLGGKKFHVIGLVSTPLGGNSSDVYVELSTLQKLAHLKGQVNTMQVRAANASSVSSVQKEITGSLSGAQVTTAKDLAKRVSGSLTDAKNLSSSLGLALELVGLLAAILITCLLTLSSVAKRVREIGTLRAIGWSRNLVVRQISLESLVQGLFGGILGAALGIVAALVITAMGWTLKATVAGASQLAGPFGFGRFAQATGSTAGSALVKITAPVDISLVGLAIALAVLGGLVAGAIGGLRAARLRPAQALRTVE